MRIFKPIPSHPRYEISVDGIVRNGTTKAIKSQYIGYTGYYMVSASYQHKSKPLRVHRLLAEVYIPNPKNLPEINHKNGIRTDNSIDNLEWCSHAENVRHAFATGLANNTGEKNGQSKLKESDVVEIKWLLGGSNGNISQAKIAKLFNVSRSTILGIHIGRLWKHIPQ